jgi:predicted AlkP superfamily phosphohydrolase/phosphomutase
MPVASKVFIIGLDGATFTVLNPMRDKGLMPNLDRLIKEGCSGELFSTEPPITPAAWTTFMTGKGPGSHGILDFERYDPETDELAFNSTTEIVGRVPTIWKILGDRGVKVGSIHVPMTYPAFEVNGFLVSGFDTSSIDGDFAYPPELKAQILERFPDYNYKTRWKRQPGGGDKLFEENCRYISSTFQQGAELAEFSGEKYGWDVLMVLLKFVDNLEHKAWRHLDPKTADENPTRRDIAANCFAVLDRAIGRMVDYARRDDPDCLIVVMSDHGHGSHDGVIQANLLLKEWGYLQTQSAAARGGLRIRRGMRRALGPKKGKFEGGGSRLSDELAVDWPRTRACVMHAGIYGFLYLNLRGRQPDETAAVDPDDYENLREEIGERFFNFQDPETGEKVFDKVLVPEDLTETSREPATGLPDLLLVPRPGLSVVRKIRGSKPVIWYPPDEVGGTHRLEGVMAFNGKGIKAGSETQAGLIDMTPTILAALGQPVPTDMEGRVVEEIFAEPISVNYVLPASEEPTGGQTDEVYSDDEKDELMERLSDLGYLE